MRNDLVELEKQSTIDWKTILLSNTLTLVCTIIASGALYFFTLEKPALQYEIFPLSSFISNQSKINIINARIENDGNKEAENVSCFFKFKSNVLLKEINIDFSYPGIKYNLIKDTINNTLQYDFVTLNANEKCSFSFLLSSRTDSLKTSDLELSVRAKGINGSSKKTNTYTGEEVVRKILFPILLLFSAMLILLGRKLIIYFLKKRKYSAGINNRDAINTLNLGVDYCDIGLYDESVILIKKLIYDHPNFSAAHSNLARAYANLNKIEFAHLELKIGKSLIQDEADKFVNNYITAQVYSLEGKTNEAIFFLSEAIKYSAERSIKKAIVDSEFYKLREHGEFLELTRVRKFT